MDWTLLYGFCAALTLALTYLSGRTGLKSLAWLLALSWVVCNAISVMCAPPVRIVLYALVDVLWLALILRTAHVSPSARIVRIPLALLYFTGLCFHAGVFLDPTPNMRLYYTALNVIFALELVTVATTGGWMFVQRTLRNHRPVPAHSGGVPHRKGAR